MKTQPTEKPKPKPAPAGVFCRCCGVLLVKPGKCGLCGCVTKAEEVNRHEEH